MARKSKKTKKGSKQVLGLSILTNQAFSFEPDTKSVAMPAQAVYNKQAWKRPDGWFEFIGLDGETYETADVIYEPISYWSPGDLVFVEGSGGMKKDGWWMQYIPVRIAPPDAF